MLRASTLKRQNRLTLAACLQYNPNRKPYTQATLKAKAYLHPEPQTFPSACKQPQNSKKPSEIRK